MGNSCCATAAADNVTFVEPLAPNGEYRRPPPPQSLTVVTVTSDEEVG